MDFAEKARSIPQGTHACFFFDNPDQQIAMTVPFLQAGLARNERCLFLGNSVNVQIVRNSLRLAGTDVEREENRGALILTSDRPYLHNGYFDHKAVIQFLDVAINGALQYGFTGLRGTGDVVWELGTKSEVEVLVEYERALDKFFIGKKLTGLCQYRRQKMLVPHAKNLADAHPVCYHLPETA